MPSSLNECRVESLTKHSHKLSEFLQIFAKLAFAQIASGTYDVGAICFKENSYFLRGKYSSGGAVQGTAKLDFTPNYSAIAQVRCFKTFLKTKTLRKINCFHSGTLFKRVLRVNADTYHRVHLTLVP